MTDREQIKAFADDLDRLVERYAIEFEISYGGIIGAMFAKCHLLCNQAAAQENEDDGGEVET